jgi:hypothetical protein
MQLRSWRRAWGYARHIHFVQNLVQDILIVRVQVAPIVAVAVVFLSCFCLYGGGSSCTKDCAAAAETGNRKMKACRRFVRSEVLGALTAAVGDELRKLGLQLISICRPGWGEGVKRR